MQSLWNGLSALTSSQQAMEALASNVANVDTPGYAEADVSFADLLTSNQSPDATAGTIQPRLTGAGWWGGNGVATVQQEVQFSGIGVQETGGATDFALTGAAFFTVRGQGGETQFTKAGNFHWTPHGTNWMLVTDSGLPVLDAKGIAVQVKKPDQVTISADGKILDAGQNIGRLGVAQVATPSQFLVPEGDNVYQLRAGGTYQILQNPASAGVGVLPGYLNTSNVNLTQTLANLVQVQNMYEINAKAVQMSNQMMGIAAQIHV